MPDHEASVEMEPTAKRVEKKGKRTLSVVKTTLALHCLSLELSFICHNISLICYVTTGVCFLQSNEIPICITFILVIFLLVLLIRPFSCHFSYCLLPRKKKLIGLYLLLYPSTLQSSPIHTNNFTVNSFRPCLFNICQESERES